MAVVPPILDIYSFSIARTPGPMPQGNDLPDYLERIDLTVNYFDGGDAGTIKHARIFPTKTGGFRTSVQEKKLTAPARRPFRDLAHREIGRGLFRFQPQTTGEDPNYGLAWAQVNLQPDGKPMGLSRHWWSHEWRAPLANRAVIEPLWNETMRIARETLGLEGFVHLEKF